MNNNNSSLSDNGQLDGTPISVTAPESVTCETQGHVKFFDAEPGFTTVINSSPDATYGVGQTNVTDLTRWLSRPREIHRWSSAVGDNLPQGFTPWEFFFNDSAVKKKLDNYALIRCKMNVKIVVNAAPIWWGTTVMSYQPKHLYTATDVGTFTIQSLCLQPHVYINPTTSQGGCMCLPFFHNANWLDLTDLNEFTNMGVMTVAHLATKGMRCSDPLTSQKVEYTVFAWASDVELSQTTSDIALQAGGEYATGPVSSVASTIANVAGRLTSIPFLAPYAKATQLASTAIGQIAHIFGFSRTPVLDNPMPMKNLPFGRTADCGTHELVDRLVVDPKNELCIDSRTAGLDGSDELSIASIASRETFLGVGYWRESAQADFMIFSAVVTPNMSIEISNGSNDVLQPTTLDFVSRPFQFWRGDIVYRVVVAASKFHRGRLLVQWDPVAPVEDTTEINLVASQILDLAVTRDMEFRVPYAGHAPFLLTDPVANYERHFNLSTSSGTAATPLTVHNNFHNGSISIKVLNPATGMSDNDLYLDVMVFVRGADNFEVAMPRNFDPDLSVVTHSIGLQSGEIPDDSQPGDFAPIGNGESVLIEAKPVTADATYDVCMGERVVSFRTLLKRYNFSENIAFDVPNNPAKFARYWTIRGRFPKPFGWVDGGTDTYAEGPGNITNMTLFNYLQGAFVGMRGSSRWKFNVNSTGQATEIIVARLLIPRSGALTGYTEVDPADTRSQRKYDLKPNFESSGYTLTNGRTQMGVEVDMPQYSRYRFISASPYANTRGWSGDETTYDAIGITGLVPETVDAGRVYVSAHHAVGDDFTFFFFLRTPIWYTAPLTREP